MIQIQYLPAAPTMTGDVSADPWATLSWHEQFTTPGCPGAEPAPGTAFAIAHDDESLFVAVKCRALSGQTSTNLSRQNVQVLIDSERAGRRAGLFVCYPDGRFSTQLELQSGGHDPWPGEIDCAAGLRSDEWSACLRLPLSQLGRSEAGLSRIRFNLTRVLAHGGEGSETGCYSYPALENRAFWMPRHAIGEAVFERPDRLQRFAWCVGPSGRGRTVAQGARVVHHQRVKVTRLGGEHREVELRAQFMQDRDGDPARTRSRLSVGAGASQVEPVAIRVPTGFRHGTLHVSLHELDSGRCVSENRILVESEPLSWKEHFVRRGDGRGGCICQSAHQQVMPRYEGRPIIPYGLATMDNGQVICVAAAEAVTMGDLLQTVVTRSDDGGATWDDYTALDGVHMRPMMLAYLGAGEVTFEAGDTSEPMRMFSHDYGRTWPERVASPPAPDGLHLGFEGSPLVERDDQGRAVRLVQTGQTLEGAAPYWKIRQFIRWSHDGGRTWPRVDEPRAWRKIVDHEGRTYDFCCGEGSLVRAANGRLVAALRTWVPPAFHDHPHFEDGLEGTAVSISDDDGDTWSPLQTVFEGGRHHPTLLKMESGDLVMVVIRRVDFRDGRLASYRRGCDAVVSRDHGATWDTGNMIVLDDFVHCDGEQWIRGACGHLSSTLLPDGSILTGYSKVSTGAVLVQWRVG
ncbi:MAG: hypothetical protein CMJ18_20020 [Phycisphaeraceae bacterium]|nr:hypothetical protein [Phycisphaeraceae bacterium]